MQEEQEIRVELLEQSSVFPNRIVQFAQAEAPQKSERKWLLLKNPCDVVLNLDRDGTILFIKPTLPSYTIEDTIGKTIYDFIAPKQHKKTRKAIKEVFKTGKSVSFETSVFETDGSLLRYSTHLSPVKNCNKVICVAQVFSNITKRKKAKKETKKYKTISDWPSYGTAMSDLKSNLTCVNDSFARMHGYTPEDMIGMPVEKLLKKEYVCEFKSRINHIKTQGAWEGETEHVRKDGTAFPTYVSVTSLKNNEGKPIGTLTITHDITASKRREEEFNIYKEKIARVEQLASLGTFSASVAHELTQPLTVIRLSIENSLAELDTISHPSTIEEDLKEGLNEISNVISIVHKFHDFARKPSETTVAKVALKATAEKIMDLLDESAWRAKVLLRVEGMDKLPPIYSHEKELEQLFYSLVVNAIQAADGKKSRQVIISGVARNEHIELQFSDNCGGIAPENLDKIFKPFFTTKPLSEGTGLGLCVVERIVYQLNGKIRVESKLGKGSTIFVTLPTKGDGR